MAQFINSKGGFGIGGKNAKMYTTTKNSKDAMLTGRPNLPSLNFEGRRGCSLIRRQVMAPMETIYEVTRAAVPIDMMMLKAMAEPMLMQCRQQEMIAVMTIAGIGTSYPTGTLETKLENGTPRSRAKEKI